MSKKNKKNNFRRINLLTIFTILLFLCLFSFFGVKNAKALPTLPPAPYVYINISVCTDTNSSNNVIFRSPFEPTIRWTPGGDLQDSYWLIVDDDPSINSPSVDRQVSSGAAEDTLAFGQIDLDKPQYYYALAIHGGRGWTPWVRGAFAISHTNGACVNGLEFCAGTVIAPSPSLCTAGYPVVNNGGNSSGGIWSWSCNGIGGGGDASCSAGTKVLPSGCATIPKPCPGVTPSTSGLCTSITSYNLGSLTDAGDHWNWSCKDACNFSWSCQGDKAIPITPSCGSDDGKAFCAIGEKPSNLCDKGEAGLLGGGTGVYEDWTWTCTGSCPTVSTDCSARGRGACGWKEVN